MHNIRHKALRKFEIHLHPLFDLELDSRYALGVFTRSSKQFSCGLAFRGVLLSCLIWCFIPCSLFAAEQNTNSFFFQVWQTEDGLPQSHITSIVQTRDGYLWMGTYNGLARFDGVRFVVFNRGNTPGLASSRITSLYEDKLGKLWIGHEGGELTCLGNGQFKGVPLGAKWPGGDILAIAEDRAGDLWLLHSSGLIMRVRGEEVVPPEPGVTGPTVLCLARDERGTLWRVHGGKLRVIGPVSREDHQPLKDHFIVRVANGHDQTWWLATGQHVWRMDSAGTFQDWGMAPWGEEPLTCMMQGVTGRLWVGTLRKGLYVLSQNGNVAHYTQADGLPQDWVRSLCQDREGTVWIGTGGGGLSAARERRVSMVHSPDHWNGRAVLSISAATNGNVWIGSEGAGAYELHDGSYRHYGNAEGLTNLFVWSISQDRKGNIWAGTWGGGLFQLVDGKFVQPTVLAGHGAPVCALYAEEDALWAGTQHGLLKLVNGHAERIGENLSRADVRTVTKARDGSIWFGTAGSGLGRWHDGQLTLFRQKDGLSSDYVWSLLPEDDGTLWIGTFGGGLCRLKAGKFSTIGSAQGLPSTVIGHLVEDGHGQLWMGSYSGILRARKEDLNRCADGILKSVTFFGYGPADGLESLECAEGLTPSGCRTPDGKLWFRTSKGPALIDPENLRTNLLAPPVIIEELIVDGETQIDSSLETTREPFKISPGRHRLEFRFTALSFVAPERVKFRYRLEGLENEWVEAGSRRTANYSFLPPGHYTLRVRACNNDGVWNDPGASLAFSVLPFFWQTWWFRIGASLAVAGLVATVARAATRRRFRKKLEHMERQRAIEKERSRIAEDIHDDIGARLTRITLLSQSARGDLDQPQQAAADLDQIYSTARELTKAMEEIVWAVNPRHDSLDSLVTYISGFAQDLLSAAGIRCRLDVPMRLPPAPVTAEVRHNLFLAFKEAINNVVRHAGATEASVGFTLEVRGFTLSVQDNGKGFDAAPNSRMDGHPLPQRAAAGNPASGNGLTNMHKRMSELGGQCLVISQAGQGTKICFALPFNMPKTQDSLS